jgi:hypothetical protein
MSFELPDLENELVELWRDTKIVKKYLVQKFGKDWNDTENDKTIYKFVLSIINDMMKKHKDKFREDGLDDLLLDFEKEDIINLMTSLVEKHRIYKFLSFYITHFKGENEPQVEEEEEEENPFPLNNFIIKDTK